MKFEEIFSFENLYEAHKQCRKSKQHKGEVIRFEINLAKNIIKINQELCLKKFKFDDYKVFRIFEPKERIIEAPSYKNRVIIRCFCDNVLKNKIEKKLIYDNVACRKNKGTSFGIKRLKIFLNKEFLKQKNNDIYFLKCDIKKYFNSIDHEILINLLKKINFSEDEMWFIKKLIKEQPNQMKIGLPLGNQSSQWFALFYLNSIDRFIKEKLRIKNYIRYMDDMILICRDKKYLQFCKREIQQKLKNVLNLELNQKTQIGKVSNGIDFLGYNITLTESGKIIIKLRASSKIRMKKHIKTLNKLKYKDKVDEEYIYIRNNAFYNHIKITKENNLKKIVYPYFTKK